MINGDFKPLEHVTIQSIRRLHVDLSIQDVYYYNILIIICSRALVVF